MNHVTISVESVQVGARTGILDRTVITVRYEHTSSALSFKVVDFGFLGRENYNSKTHYFLTSLFRTIVIAVSKFNFITSSLGVLSPSSHTNRTVPIRLKK